MRKYSYEINALRGMCAIIIILFHLNMIYDFKYLKWFSSGFYAVEFFFILSGFLVAKKVINSDKKNIEISFSKIKKIYPAYLLSIILLIIIFISKWYSFNFYKWLGESQHNKSLISELLLIQTTGLSDFNFINFPGWYCSALIISSFICGFIIRTFRKFTKEILLIISMIIYIWFYKNCYIMNNYYLINSLYSTAILRSIAGVFLGASLFMYTDKYINKINKINNKLFNVLVTVSLFLFIMLLVHHNPERMRYVIIIPSCILILTMFSKECCLSKFLNLKPFQILGNISFELYIFQSFCSNLMSIYFPNIRTVCAIFLCLLLNIIIAIIFHYIIEFIKKQRSIKNEI